MNMRTNKGFTFLELMITLSLSALILMFLIRFLTTNVALSKSAISSLEYQNNARMATKVILDALRQSNSTSIKYNSTTQTISTASGAIFNFLESNSCPDNNLKIWYYKASDSAYGDLRSTSSPPIIYVDKLLSITAEPSSNESYLKLTVTSGIRNDSTAQSCTIFIGLKSFSSEIIYSYSGSEVGAYSFGDTSNNPYLWQSFTAGDYPVLSSVDLKVRRAGGENQSDIVLNLYAMSDQLPSGSSLASTSISSNLVSKNYTSFSQLDTWSNLFSLFALTTLYDYSIVSGIFNYTGLVSGEEYSISLSQQTNNSSSYYEWCTIQSSSSSSLGNKTSSGSQILSTSQNGWLIVHTTLLTTTPTPTPTLCDAPTQTSDTYVLNSTSASLSGVSIPNSTITITTSLGDITCTAKNNGEFTVTVPLTKNAINTFTIYAVDSLENRLTNELIATITQISEPTLIMDSYYKSNSNPKIYGTAVPGATVKIYLDQTLISQTTADSDGEFSVPITLNLNQANNLSMVQTIEDHTSSSNAFTIYHDDTTPTPPQISPSTYYTNQSTYTLSGTAEAYATITDGINTYSGTADENGNFIISLVLNSDTDNIFNISQKDRAGNTSNSTEITIIQDNSAPAEAPLLTTASYTTISTTATVSGKSEAYATITVSNGTREFKTQANINGNFSVDVTLDTGVDNIFTVSQTDRAENTGRLTSQVTITNSDNIPIISTTSYVTNLITGIPIQGTGKSNGTITITGGNGTFTSTVSPDKTFSIPVNLYADTANTLVASLSSSLFTSSVIIIQDSTPPTSAPSFLDTAFYSNSSSVDVSGTAEAYATITITDGSRTYTDTANKNGNFKVTVALDYTNETRTFIVSQTDQAGNTSNLGTSITITQDTIAPTSAPSIGFTSEYINSTSTIICGTAEAYATVSISYGGGTYTGTADSTGYFNITVNLTEGTNTLTISQADRAGNICNSTTTVTVYVDTVVPSTPSINSSSYSANSSTATISGYGEANALISFTIGTYTTYTICDSSGYFETTVTVDTSTTTAVIVVQFDEAENKSPEITVQIMYGTPTPYFPQGLMGNYYTDTSFTNLNFRRLDSDINFSWGDGGPLNYINDFTNNFSVQWNGYFIPPTSGDYTFRLSTDDNGKLYINNCKIIDSGGDKNASPQSLIPNNYYPLKVQFTENTGIAKAILTCQTPDSNSNYVSIGSYLYTDPYVFTPTPSPTVTPTYEPVVSGLFCAGFYNNTVNTRLDSDINFNWGSNSPGSIVSNATNNFSMYWNGYFIPPVTGNYTFRVNSNDTAKLFLDSVKLIDGGGSKTSTAQTLTSNTRYPLWLFYTETTDSAFVTLTCQTPSSDSEYVSISPYLYSYPVSPTVIPTPGNVMQGLRGDYYTDTVFLNLGGYELDSNINFDWGICSPGSLVNNKTDYFSIKWTGYFIPTVDGNYTFRLNSDNNKQLYLDNTKIIDGSGEQTSSNQTLYANIMYPLKVLYNTFSRNSNIYLACKTPSSPDSYVSVSNCLYTDIDNLPTPSEPPVRVSNSSSIPGLLGKYYSSTSLANICFSKPDSDINFNWGSGNPGFLNYGVSDNFCVKWEGYFVPPQNGTYTFKTAVDESARLILDNKILIESTATKDSDNLTLIANNWYPIQLKFTELAGNASITLTCKTPWSGSNYISISSYFYMDVTPTPELYYFRSSLFGKYYNDTSARSYKGSRYDSDISFNWNTGNSGTLSNGNTTNTDNFSAWWTGYFIPPTTGSYTFKLDADDYANFYINDTSIVTKGCTSTQKLTSGIAYPIKLFYSENTGGASVYLTCQTPWSGSDYVSLSPYFYQQATPTPIPTISYTSFSTGLYTRYYTDQFYGNLYSTGISTNINFSWGSGSPGSCVNNRSDNFSIIWDGYFIPPCDGNYTFKGLSDGNMILYLNNTHILESNSNSNTSYSPTLPLTGGNSYPITVKYTVGSGNANVSLTFENTQDNSISSYIYNNTVSPTNTPVIYIPDALMPTTTPSILTQGIKGSYYSDVNQYKLVSSRIDSDVNFTWGSNSPGKVINDLSDSFSVIWQGYFIPPNDGNYSFRLQSDDSGTLYFNNASIIKTNNSTYTSFAKSLTANIRYPIKIIFVENGGSASVTLTCQTPSSGSDYVSIGPYLYSEPTPTCYPLSQGIYGQYYTDNNWSSFYSSCIDSDIYFDWGSGGPGNVVDNTINNFSIQWRGYFKAPSTGTYTFKVNTDDGCRFMFDKILYVNTPNSGYTGNISPMNLTQNMYYPILLNYEENNGSANAKITCQIPSSTSFDRISPYLYYENTSIPTPSSNSNEIYLQGIRSFGYTDTSWTNLFNKGINTDISFDWGSGSPGNIVNNMTNYFSMAWYGYFVPTVDGTYTFKIDVNDVCKTYLNNILILDSDYYMNFAPVNLTANYKYPLLVKYIEYADNSTVSLKCKIPGGSSYDSIQSYLRYGCTPTTTPNSLNSGLKGDYYNSSGNLIGTRSDSEINFDWGTGSPGEIIGTISNNFTVQWTGYFIPYAEGKYQFNITADDSARLYLNDTLINTSVSQYLNTMVRYPIKVVYTEIEGSASVRVTCSTPYSCGSYISIYDLIYNTPIPTSSYLGEVTQGLLEKFYTGTTWTNYNFSDIDLDINFNLSSGNFGIWKACLQNSSSIQWSGYFIPPVTGDYMFKATVDDYVKVTLGNFDILYASNSSKTSLTYYLNSNSRYPIIIKYYQGGGDASLSLTCKTPSSNDSYVSIDPYLYTNPTPTYEPIPLVNGLLGKYYKDTTWSTVSASRQDSDVYFNWHTNAPDIISDTSDNFTVQWDGYFIPPNTGDYTFHIYADNAAYIYLCNVQIFSNENCPNTDATPVTLTENVRYPIKIKFKESNGDARIMLTCKTPSSPNSAISVSSYFYTQPTSTPTNTPPLFASSYIGEVTQGLLGKFYTDNTWTNYTFSKIDSDINFDWVSGSYGLWVGCYTDDFSIQWSGYFIPPVTGNYIFKAEADDNVKVTLGNSNILSSGGTSYSSTYYLNAASRYPIIIKYNEGKGTAKAILTCKTPNSNDSYVSIGPYLYTNPTPTYGPLISGLFGKYYNDINWSTVSASRKDSDVNFNWDTGSPGIISNTDSFTVQWDGYFIPPTTGNYTFHTQSDDGSWISLYGISIFSDEKCPNKDATTVYLTENVRYPIQVKFKEKTGGAYTYLTCKTPISNNYLSMGSYFYCEFTTNNSSTPTCTFTPTPIVVAGLYCSYYKDIGFTNLTNTLLESDIDFDWGSGSPGSVVDNLIDRFSMRALGYFVAPSSGNYTFCIKSDDGCKLYLNNSLILDNWRKQTATESYSSTQTLTASTFNTLQIDYYEISGSASIKITCNTPSSNGRYVSIGNYLYTTPGMSSSSSSSSDTPIASTVQIECENASMLSNCSVGTSSNSSGGKYVGWCETNDYFILSNVDLRSKTKLTVRMFRGHVMGGSVSIYRYPDMTKICNDFVPPITGKWGDCNYIENSFTLYNCDRISNVMVKFNGDCMGSFDWMKFE